MMDNISFFIRENKNDLFPEDLLYPIKYTGLETDEKKIKEKIIAGVLKCDKNKTKKDSEFGELAVFENKSENESVTYVVSRKPFYNISSLTTNTVVCLKKKRTCGDEDAKLLQLIFSSTEIKELFSSCLKKNNNYLEYIFESNNFTDFDILYRFLNNNESSVDNPYKMKNICHCLYAFFKEKQPETKNLLENILMDEDYKNN